MLSSSSVRLICENVCVKDLWHMSLVCKQFSNDVNPLFVSNFHRDYIKRLKFDIPTMNRFIKEKVKGTGILNFYSGSSVLSCMLGVYYDVSDTDVYVQMPLDNTYIPSKGKYSPDDTVSSFKNGKILDIIAIKVDSTKIYDVILTAYNPLSMVKEFDIDACSNFYYPGVLYVGYAKHTFNMESRYLSNEFSRRANKYLNRGFTMHFDELVAKQDIDDLEDN